MSLATMQFDCPPAKWQGIRRALSAKEIYVPDVLTGEINHDGVIVAFRRDGDKLTVYLLKLSGWKLRAAWAIKKSSVIAKVRELFEQV